MVLSYYELTQSRKELASSIELLELKYKTTQILATLNGASALDVQKAKSDLDSAKNSLASLDQSISSLLSSINLFLGRNASDPVIIKPFEAADIKAIQARDVEKDLKTALSSSNNIKIAENTLSRLYNSRDAAELMGPMANTTVFDAAIKSQALNIKSLKQNLEKSFRELDQSLSQQILNLQAAELNLSLAEKTFSVETVKYNIGMTSLTEYKTAQLALLSAQDAFSKAQRTLYSSWERYKWYTKGVDVSSTSSQSSVG
jgi:outer membrane protein TolC